MSTVTRIDEELKLRGIPIAGVREVSGVYVVDYLNTATREQRDEAEATIASMDLRPRRPKAASVLFAEILDLGNADFKKLVTAMLVRTLRSDPHFARRVNVLLDGDEVG